MPLRDVLSIAIPAIGLLVLAQPGRPRWARRPWFVSGPPRRWWFGLFFGVLMVGAIIHVVV